LRVLSYLRRGNLILVVLPGGIKKKERTKKRQSMGSDDDIILIQINMVPYVAPTNYIEKAGATVVRGHT
jgi:hypothetical protein